MMVVLTSVLSTEAPQTASAASTRTAKLAPAAASGMRLFMLALITALVLLVPYAFFPGGIGAQIKRIQYLLAGSRQGNENDDVSGATRQYKRRLEFADVLPQPPPLLMFASGAVVAFRPGDHSAGISLNASLLKPVAIELGAVLLCQAVGLPLLSKLGLLLKKVRLAGRGGGIAMLSSLSSRRGGVLAGRFLTQRYHGGPSRLLLGGGGGGRISQSLGRQVLRPVAVHGGRFYKGFEAFYKKTAASKVVTRSKRLLKEIFHLPDHHHHDHEEE